VMKVLAPLSKSSCRTALKPPNLTPSASSANTGNMQSSKAEPRSYSGHCRGVMFINTSEGRHEQSLEGPRAGERMLPVVLTPNIDG
jgi:hypothetical protein